MEKLKKFPRPMIYLFHSELKEFILKVRFTNKEEKFDFNVDQEKKKADEALKEFRTSLFPLNPFLFPRKNDVEEDIPVIFRVLNPELTKNTKTKETIKEIEFFLNTGSYRTEDIYTFVREKLKTDHQIQIPKFDPKIICFEELTNKIAKKSEKEASLAKLVSDIIKNHKDVKGKIKKYETPSSQIRLKIIKILKLDYKKSISEGNLRQILKRLDYSESRTL